MDQYDIDPYDMGHIVLATLYKLKLYKTYIYNCRCVKYKQFGLWPWSITGQDLVFRISHMINPAELIFDYWIWKWKIKTSAEYW